MTIFDKAQWHIDSNEKESEVLKKFFTIFHYLQKNAMLSEDGTEILNIGIDESVSLNERMVNQAGYNFLKHNYDKIINLSSSEMELALLDHVSMLSED